ncbi:Pr6Pr family membrane protein [Modestobacter sp. SYSU DS0290]
MSDADPTLRTTAARVWWAVLAVVVAASVGTELVRALLDTGSDAGALARVVRFLSWFTIQSNLLVLVAALPLVRDPGHDGRIWRVVRLDALLGISVTGLVFAAVLAPTTHPQGLGWWTNAGTHYVVPVVAVVGWLVFGPRPRVTGTTIVAALGWPLAWIAYTLAHGALTGWYPYGFLDAQALGYGTALRNLGVVVALSVAFLLVVGVLDRRLPPTGAPRLPAVSRA